MFSRRLFTFAALISLLLCAGSTALYVRSITGKDYPQISFQQVGWQIVCRQGMLSLSNQPQRDAETAEDRRFENEESALTEALSKAQYGSPEYQRQKLLFRKVREAHHAADAVPHPPRTPEVLYEISLGYIVPLSAVLPVLGYWVHQRARAATVERRLLDVLCVCSLAILLATGVVWIRSYWNYDSFCEWRVDRNHRLTREFSADLSCGIVYSHHERMRWFSQEGFDQDFRVQESERTNSSFGVSHYSSTASPQSELWPGFSAGFNHVSCAGLAFQNRSGRGFRDFDGQYESRSDFIQIHLWVVALFCVLFALPSLVRLGKERVRRRIGHCRCCGYDLRASPDRCPECGTPIRAAKGVEGAASVKDSRPLGRPELRAHALAPPPAPPASGAAV